MAEVTMVISVSVIIVSWNAKAFLLECLESVFAQQLTQDLEVIVVDNASTDGSAEAVRDRFPSVSVLGQSSNLGFARANNIGIRTSRGEYLFLINSDVVVSQGCFATLLQFLTTNPGVGIVGPRIIGSDGCIQRSCMGFPNLWSVSARAVALDCLFPRSRVCGGLLLKPSLDDPTRSVDVINGCFWLIRRAAVQEVGLLDERFLMYGEDVDWCRRFHEHHWDVVFCSEADALHYGGASSANAPLKFYLEMQRANYQYWQKHHSALSSRLFLIVTLLHHVVRVVGRTFALLLPRMRQKRLEKLWRDVASIRWGLNTMVESFSSGKYQTAERAL